VKVVRALELAHVDGASQRVQADGALGARGKVDGGIIIGGWQQWGSCSRGGDLSSSSSSSSSCSSAFFRPHAALAVGTLLPVELLTGLAAIEGCLGT
jgi:hypothetical protein